MALESADENLCLVNVSAQRGRFAPEGGCPAVRAGDTVTFEPRQLAGHFLQLIAQRADQLHGLGGIAFIHGGIVASLASSCRRNGPGREDSQRPCPCVEQLRKLSLDPPSLIDDGAGVFMWKVPSELG
jgi:hypothetical protein